MTTAKAQLLIALFVASSAHAQVYKCKTAKGSTEYSDHPCAAVAEPVRIQAAPKDARVPGDDPNARALRMLEASKRRQNPPPECKFSSYAYGDSKGKVLAQNAKEECLRNLDLKATGRSDEVSRESYSLWRDHHQLEQDDRNAALSRKNYVDIQRLKGR